MRVKLRTKVGVVCLSTILSFAPTMSVHAICFEWNELLPTKYCATPICHTGNRTEFIEKHYERICTDGLLGFTTERKSEKIDNGCCPYNR